LLALTILVIPSGSSAQSLPTLASAKIKAAVTYSSGIFTYSYSVQNDPASGGSIWVMSVDISKPNGTATLEAQGLVNGTGFLANSSQVVLNQSSTVPMVPVGLQAPPGWLVSQSVSGTASWGAGSSASLILPGATLDGFQIASPGVPGIRTCVVKPHLDSDNLPIAPLSGPGDLDRYLQDLSVIEDSVKLTIQTVAPTSPPNNLNPIDFLGTIQTYKEEALKFGWIENPGIANSLDAKISAALAALQGGDNNTAKNILNALMNEVDAQAGKHLTPEAVALIKFNTQFLISKIS
jgi:hypothetical protein